MAKRLEDKLRELPPKRREKVRKRTEQLIAEEKTLADMRHAFNLTQNQMAELMGIGQEGISRIEKRSDLLLSTLRSYIAAMGGELHIVAEFPDRPAVSLSGFSDLDSNISESDQINA